jgi:hypothetical protein
VDVLCAPLLAIRPYHLRLRSGQFLETPLGFGTVSVQWTGVGDLERVKDVSRFRFATGGWLRISLKEAARRDRPGLAQS